MGENHDLKNRYMLVNAPSEWSDETSTLQVQDKLHAENPNITKLMNLPRRGECLELSSSSTPFWSSEEGKNRENEGKMKFFIKKSWKHFAVSKISYTFASQLRNRCTLSSVGRAIDS